MIYFYYAYISTEFEVSIYIPYDSYNDIVRYYNVADELHSSEVIQAHYNMAIL